MTFIRISSALDQFISDFKELIVFCEHKYLYNYLGNSHNCPDITKDLLFIFLPPGSLDISRNQGTLNVLLLYYLLLY